LLLDRIVPMILAPRRNRLQALPQSLAHRPKHLGILLVNGLIPDTGPDPVSGTAFVSFSA
jgi:hypothetical protein